jgi:DNA-3-methyladenine glycosylase
LELLDRASLAAPAPSVAPVLLNQLLVAADGRAGRIIEVEAYGGPPHQGLADQGLADPAAHSYRGSTKRNATMFGPPGHLYVYFSYGVHWCANVVTSPAGEASAVLLRALEPISGLDLMRAARWRTQKRQVDLELCRGPGRLAQAMGIDRGGNGIDLCSASSPVFLATDGTAPPPAPSVTPRIGISVAQDVLWRFSVPDHPGVSGRRSGGKAQPDAEHEQDSLDRLCAGGKGRGTG